MKSGAAESVYHLKKHLSTLPQQHPPPSDVGQSAALTRALNVAEDDRMKRKDTHIGLDHLLKACAAASRPARCTYGPAWDGECVR